MEKMINISEEFYMVDFGYFLMSVYTLGYACPATL